MLPLPDSPATDSDTGSAGTAYVVILHLAPDVESNLVHILQQETDLSVVAAEDGAKLRPDTVSVISPGQHLALSNGRLHVEQVSTLRDPYSIDRFFRSLASDQGANAVGVVLSGSGTDGTLGLRAIKEAGGLAMVQAPEGAEYPQMPESALATGIVDRSLPADELAKKLVEYRDQAGVIQLPETEESLEETEQATLAKIFEELRRVTELDFSGYKHSTVLRRLERRLQLSGTKTLEQYLDLLRSDSDETDALRKDLLISVTSFFRDAEAFEALENDVIPDVFSGKSAGDAVRVWVAGCATGEEAYSIMMLLLERAEEVGFPLGDVQVFATDVDAAALQVGRRGRYPKAVATDISEERFQRVFQIDGDYAQISPGLQDHVLFARHNLLEDPPFSDLDLVSCRNLLIYLIPDLQRHVYQLLHYGLQERGYLFLGRSEAIAPADRLFEAADPSHNIFRARNLPKHVRRQAATSSFLRRRPSSHGSGRRNESEIGHRSQKAFGPAALSGGRLPSQQVDTESAETARALRHRALMEEVASVLVTEDKEIIHISGSADRYLHFEEGVPTSDLLGCVPETIRPQLRTAVYQAFEEGGVVHRTGLALTIEGELRQLSLSVRPITHDGTRYVHVRFEDLARSGTARASDPALESEREAQLQQDLYRTQEQLEATAEEHEAVAEEMETANEELLSMNEELQSKNEELETNKEELQSVNEELETTNQELKSRMEDLRRSKGAPSF